YAACAWVVVDRGTMRISEAAVTAWPTSGAGAGTVALSTIRPSRDSRPRRAARPPRVLCAYMGLPSSFGQDGWKALPGQAPSRLVGQGEGRPLTSEGAAGRGRAASARCGRRGVGAATQREAAQRLEGGLSDAPDRRHVLRRKRSQTGRESACGM